MTSLKEDFWKYTDPKVTERLTLRVDCLPAQLWEYQQLKSLTLSYCNLGKLPPEIGQLKNLESLILNRNKLKQLPDEICQLSKLRRLDLNSNELECLPDKIGALSKLKNLNVEFNYLESFPDSMQNLKELELFKLKKANLKGKKVMDFPPCFLGMDAWLKSPLAFDGQGTVRKLGKSKEFLKIIKKCIDLEIGYSGRVVFYNLYYKENPQLDKRAKKYVFQALNLYNAHLQDKAFDYLLKQGKTKTIQKGDELLILGKLEHLELKEVAAELKNRGLVLTKQCTAKTSHVLIGLAVKDFQQIYNKESIVFLREAQLQEFLDQGKDLYLTEATEIGEQGRQNIKTLLLSRIEENIELAVQLIKGGGSANTFKTELFIASQCTAKQSIKKEIKSLLSLHLTASGKKALTYFRYAIANTYSETYFKQRVRKYLYESKDFDVVFIVRYFQRYDKLGLHYALTYFSAADALAFIQEFFVIDRSTLDLSGIYLEDIPKVWHYAATFTELEVLRLVGCGLTALPRGFKAFCQRLPKLRQLNFEENAHRLRLKLEKEAWLKAYTILV